MSRTRNYMNGPTDLHSGPLDQHRLGDEESTGIALGKPTRRDLPRTLILAARCRNPEHDWSK